MPRQLDLDVALGGNGLNKPLRVYLKIKDGLVAGYIRGTLYTPPPGKWNQHDPCVYCFRKSENDEHVKPRSWGGKRLDNIARACERCNKHRGSEPLLQYLLSIWRN